MCDRTGCDLPGRNVPQVVNRIRNGRQKWDVPMITGLRFCDKCKALITEPIEIIGGDDLKALTDALLRARPGSKLVRQTLGWITTDHPHYKKLLDMGPKDPTEGVN